MGLTFDISALLAQAVPNTQTVAYFSPLADGQLGAPIQVQFALRRAPTKDELDLFPDIEVVWHLWRAYLGGVVPVAKGVISDQGTGDRWQISPKKSAVQAWGQRFRCMTFKENF